MPIQRYGGQADNTDRLHQWLGAILLLPLMAIPIVVVFTGVVDALIDDPKDDYPILAVVTFVVASVTTVCAIVWGKGRLPWIITMVTLLLGFGLVLLGSTLIDEQAVGALALVLCGALTQAVGVIGGIVLVRRKIAQLHTQHGLAS